MPKSHARGTRPGHMTGLELTIASDLIVQQQLHTSTIAESPMFDQPDLQQGRALRTPRAGFPVSVLLFAQFKLARLPVVFERRMNGCTPCFHRAVGKYELSSSLTLLEFDLSNGDAPSILDC